MSVIKDYTDLRDAWVDTHPNVPSAFPPNMTPADALHTFGVTADSPVNTYSAGKPLDAYARQFMGKRLDYVLYRPPVHSSRSSNAPVLEPTQSDVVFTEHVPTKRYSFSDHFGLEATFSIRLPEGQPGDVHDPSGVEAPAASNPGPVLSDGSITTLIQTLTTAYRHSRSKLRLHLGLFFGSLVFVIGLTVGSAWLPHSWINPIFLFVTTVIAWLATTMLYVGFIFDNYEANTLNNVIEELELYSGSIKRD